MGLKVILYDPKGEVEYLLSDIFEVTGHTLYSLKGDKKEILDKVSELDSYLFILPAEDKDLWINALQSKVLFPFFILGSDEEAEFLLKRGFSELNLIPIPFNPLDLLNKLTTVDKLEPLEDNLKELGFINTLLKLYLHRTEHTLKVKTDTKECFVKVNPLSTTCSLNELIDILSEEYTLELTLEDIQTREVFDSLGRFAEELLKEEQKVSVKPVRELAEEFIEEIEEGFLSVQKILNNGITRRNFYLLKLQGRGKEIVLSVGLPELSGFSLIDKALNKLNKTLKDLTAILLPTCSFQELEVLKRLSLKIPKLNVIGRRKLEELFKLYGVGNIRFKAIEDIPLLKAGLATGHTLAFIPLSDGLSIGIKIKDKLFTGKLFGSFNTEDSEVRKIFHRILYPSRDVLLLDLRTLIPHISDARVYPLFGPEVDNPERVYTELRDYRYTPNLVKFQEALYLLNLTLDYLTDEEREKLLERIGSYVELGDKIAMELYTDPNLFMSELFNALVYSINSPDRFFNILKELFNYGIYIPPSEV